MDYTCNSLLIRRITLYNNICHIQTDKSSVCLLTYATEAGRFHQDNNLFCSCSSSAMPPNLLSDNNLTCMRQTDGSVGACGLSEHLGLSCSMFIKQDWTYGLLDSVFCGRPILNVLKLVLCTTSYVLSGFVHVD